MQNARLVVIACLSSVAAIPAQETEDVVSVERLLKALRARASEQQMAIMKRFAAQKDAPAAIPRLVAVMRAKAPRMDNNVCLTIEQILRQHPGARCPLEPLIEAIERRVWNSRQKAAQAFYYAITKTTLADEKALAERIARALVPLTASQRSRVFRAGTKCLQKLTGLSHGPDAAKWLAWFEERFEKKIDVAGMAYELVAVVRERADGDQKSYELNGTPVGDGAALRKRLEELREDAKERKLRLTAVLQVEKLDVAALTKAKGLADLPEPMRIFLTMGLPATMSPMSDVFREPWRPE